MTGHARRRPKRLAAKLLHIRTELGLSRAGMIKRLGVKLCYRSISNYERDKSEPSLEVLLAYSRVSNVSLAQIVDDDELELISLFATSIAVQEKKSNK